MSNKLDQFEQNIKDKLDELSFEPSMEIWENVQKQLPKSNNNYFKYVASLLFITTLSLVGYFYFATPKSNTAEKLTSKENKKPIQKVISTIDTIKQSILKPSTLKNKTEEQPTSNENKVAGNNSIQQKEVENTIIAEEPVYVQNDSTVKNKDNFKEEEGTIASEPKKETLSSPLFSISHLKKCANQPIQFTPNDTQKEGFTYFWDFGNGETSDEYNAEYSYPVAGNYQAKLTAIHNSDSITWEMPSSINILPVPELEISIENPDNFSEKHEHSFHLQSFQTDQFIWTCNGEEISRQKSFQKLFFTPGNYEIKLLGINNHQCSTTVAKKLEVKTSPMNSEINAFTPDGDGINDTWLPAAVLFTEFPFNLMIFDRFGKLVYQTDNKNRPWDGRILGSNENAKNRETYMWQLTFTDNQGVIHQDKGSVTVVGR
jgi:gliding motility-associated-like protein